LNEGQITPLLCISNNASVNLITALDDDAVCDTLVDKDRVKRGDN